MSPARLLLLLIGLLTYSSVSSDEEYSEANTQPRRLQRHVSETVYNPLVFTRKLRIVTVENEPYTIVTRNDGSGPNPTYSYHGFIPDLVLSLSKRLHFNYELYNVSVDYGHVKNNSTKEWTGLIGEVMRRDKNDSNAADLAAAAITITSAREYVVNFLKPFLHHGLTVVIRRPDITVSLPYSFGIFQPLDAAVWGLILFALIVVGLFLWLMNMYNPYEWAGRYSIGLADHHHAELFNLAGSMWFVFTSVQWQGFERAPRSIASKFLTCVWFAFVTVTLVTYTAGIVNNLYWASMTHTSSPSRPRYVDLAHIVNSKDVKYGTLANSQTYWYVMKVAVGEEFDVMRRYWQSDEGQSQLVSTVEEGLQRVRGGEYAFIMEGLSAKYVINRRPCDLVTVGEPFGSRSYGFAVPKSMSLPELDAFNRALLEMTEEGDIEALGRRWFTDRGQCWNVTATERLVADVNSALYVDKPRSVDVTTFTGPFVLIIVGVIISVAIAFAEILYYRQHGRYQSNRAQGRQLSMDPDEGNI